LGERIVTYVKEESEEFVKSKPHIDNIINAVNDYFKVEEFAPSLGEVKGNPGAISKTRIAGRF